jgi:hypothetical protein
MGVPSGNVVLCQAGVARLLQVLGDVLLGFELLLCGRRLLIVGELQALNDPVADVPA